MQDNRAKNFFLNQRSGFSGIILSMLLLVGFSFLNPSTSFAQDYGLGFFGAESSKDNRTKLDLNPEDYFSFHDEFELSFSLRLRPLLVSDFGYVARIIDKKGNNIDIIYNGPDSHSLQIINGDELTSISVPDNLPGLYDKWTEIRLKFDLKNRTLQLNTPDTSLVDSDIDLDGKVKILFGANDFAPFKTTDVPAMNIKDIKIYRKGKRLHHFPLDESADNFADDLISKKKAYVQNPSWIKLKYHNWEQPFHFTILHGFAAITYDSRDEEVYMVGDEQLKLFQINIDTITTIVYSKRFTDLQPGSQVLFDTVNNMLICYNLMFKTVHSFNFSSFVWEKISQGPISNTALRYHNKYFSGPDSLLYIFGGYGQHKYFKLIQRYDFKSQKWDTLQPVGDIFHPRMHAASGIYGDTIYILGGYGSMSGDQILNPQHYTDLMAFSLTEKKFIKKYEYKAPLEDIDFAHSMVLDMDDQSYYVLASTIFEYDSYLQLLKGNLRDPELIMLGNKIPYVFDNEYSFADLYLSKTSQKLIAATSLAYTERNETEIKVYTISFPPHFTETEDIDTKTLPKKVALTILIVLFSTVLIVLLIWYFRRKNTPHGIHESDSKTDESVPIPLIPEIISGENGVKRNNTILFFGGFQIINKDGDDITNKFTPLLKELFLLIFLNSIKDKGISVLRITELLWFSMDDQSANNNRAVNIAKLKNLLVEIEGCNLSRKTSYWKIVFNDTSLYNDYWSSLKMLNQNNLQSKEQIHQLLNIIQKGPLLGNADYEWLDEFKADFSNLIIDSLTQYSSQIKIESDPEFINRLADAILIFDMLHEEAISLKCRALNTLGKHSMAMNLFTKFCKDYMTLYDEQYHKSFSDIIKSEKDSQQKND
ncbi:MAG TPA: hypothetical protein ENI20_01865 [Bacteroides sp.]|nr:hypothetical protein [Bacteroides sp.]